MNSPNSVVFNRITNNALEGIYSTWARTTKRGFSLPVSGQRHILFFGELIMSRIQHDVIAVWIV